MEAHATSSATEFAYKKCAELRQAARIIWASFHRELFHAYGDFVARQIGANKILAIPKAYKHLYKQCVEVLDDLNKDTLMDVCWWAARHGDDSSHVLSILLELRGLNEPARKHSEQQFIMASFGGIDRTPVCYGKLAHLIDYFGWYADNIYAEEHADLLLDHFDVDVAAVLGSMNEDAKKHLLPRDDEDFKEWANTPARIAENRSD